MTAAEAGGGLEARLAPGWRVRRLDTLSAEERGALLERGEDPDYVALACPDRAGFGVRALDAAATALLERLAETTPLTRMPELPRDELCRLVLDGLVELRRGAEAATGLGARAWLERDLGLALGRDASVPDRLAALSDTALHLACDLPADEDVVEVALWLYRFHRLPLDARWRRAAREASALEWIDARCGGDVTLPLARGFSPVAHPDWYAWRWAGATDERRYAFKLYVSALPEAMPEVTRRSFEVLADARVPHLKLARALTGLARPDKLIAYFDQRDELFAAAEALARALRGQPAHGVPFSAALTADGLLSWGEDPAPRPALRGWRGQQSWRLWIAQHLARALVSARSAGADVHAASAHARARLWLEGVDPRQWAPRNGEGAAA